MKPKIYRAVYKTIMPIGNYRSLPTEVGTAVPSSPVRDPRPLVHPAAVTTTVEIGVATMEPANDSILALEHPPESPSVPAEAA